LKEEGFEVLPPNPDWLIKQLNSVNDIENRMVQKRMMGESAASYQQIRKSAAQFCQDIRDR
jgi:hypothetical protein